MNGNDIRIGSPNASQPALLGNETVDLLIRLTEQVQYLAKIASTSQIWPGGVPAPDGTSNTIGTNIDSVCETLLNKLKFIKKFYDFKKDFLNFKNFYFLKNYFLLIKIKSVVYLKNSINL